MNEQHNYINDSQIAKAERIAFLISGYIQQSLTHAEHNELDEWVAASDENMQLFEELTDEKKIQETVHWLHKTDTSQMLEKVKTKLSFANRQSFYLFSKFWYYSVAAAAVLLLLAGGIYWWTESRPSKAGAQYTSGPVPLTLEAIQPGTNKAILRLANGSTIALSDAQTGRIATETGAEVIKLADGQLEYRLKDENGYADIPYNIITTPQGGQYQVLLSDGTRVWLNAASSIRYPVAFSGNERKVFITGEAYFEVSKDAGRPFKVDMAAKGEIEVLGTHFNVNAYGDEASLNTTLLEGSVKVTAANGQSSMLRPGQQARISNNKLQVAGDIDTDEVMAWKNGLFNFKSADIEVMMRQAARWYDIEVVYENRKPADRFTGKVSRQVNLSQWLKILEYSEVKARLEQGRRLIIIRE